jgi:hypothetical protein
LQFNLSLPPGKVFRAAVLKSGNNGIT